MDANKPSQRAHIKGSILIARSVFVEKKGGTEAWKRVLNRLEPGDQSLLNKLLLPSSWYPMELGLRLDAAIVEEFSPGNPDQLYIDLGRSSAEVNLAGSEKVFVRAGQPHALLQSSTRIYQLYYQVGWRTAEKTSPTSTVVRTFEAEEVTRTDCLTVMGWYQKALEMCGCLEVTYEHTKCRVRGDEICEYTFRWSSCASA
jgi:hypothetical protein